MSGEHLADLAKRAAPMLLHKANDARGAWAEDAATLSAVAKSLANAAPQVLLAFGEHSDTGKAAQKAFEDAAAKVKARAEEMTAVAETMVPLVAAMRAAHNAAADQPPKPADEAPKHPDMTGDPTVDVPAVRGYSLAGQAHAYQVGAYAAGDEDARRKVEALKTSYAHAIKALAVIHGDPDLPPPGGDPNGSPTPRGTTGPGGPHTPVPVVSSPPVLPGGPHHPPGGVTGGPDFPYPVTPIAPTPGGEVHGVAPGGSIHGSGPGGFGGGVGPAVLGGGIATAGVFGAPGLINGVRGLLSGRGFGASPGAIGSSTRAGGPGTLGRGAAGNPGSQVNRSGGRGGAGGRGGGTAGTAGGRRTGAGAGGVGGRGGKRGKNRDEDQRDRDLFDDGADWLDDEGSAPPILD